MGRLAGFRYREITRKLKTLGFAFDRQAAGSHEIWFHATSNRYTTIPNHPVTCPRERCVPPEAGWDRSRYFSQNVRALIHCCVRASGTDQRLISSYGVFRPRTRPLRRGVTFDLALIPQVLFPGPSVLNRLPRPLRACDRNRSPSCARSGRHEKHRPGGPFPL